MTTLNLSWLSLTSLFSIVFAMCVVCVSCQCLESERNHLLQLKEILKLPDDGQYSGEKLVSWNNQSLNCCSWRGIGCNEGGKIISLDLSSEGITEGINDSSSLFSLKYLERLNLASNNFYSIFPTKFHELINLNYLNLSFSSFSGQIPIGISSLVNLKTLHISNIHFDGDTTYELLTTIKLENPNLDTLIRNLSNLQELILDGVIISAKDNNWGRAISSSLPNLQVLSLSGCGLKGTIDFSLSKLIHLSEIRLSHNDLNGVFPKQVFHLQTLWAIDLTMNRKLQGPFPEISKNNSLEELVLSNTNLSGGIFNSIIENLASLSKLDISYCRFNGAIPKSLSNLTKLTHIDLSGNMFIGSIHSTHWEGLTKLESLDLRSNSFTGSIPLSVFCAPSLKRLYLSNNQFSEISNEHLNMSSSSSQLSVIDLSYNIINGPFPLLELKELVELDLSRNSFSGPFPLMELNDLVKLDLSQNDFSSPFPLLELKKLSYLDLSRNNFSGPIPDFNMKNLRSLDLSSNNLSGPFPNSLFKCENLSYLILSHNSFSGEFNTSMINRFQLLSTIDLSYNDLVVVDNSANVPSSLPHLEFVSLASCKLKRFPGFLRNQSNLYHLDLSQNQISGEIPNWIWEGQIYDLNLSHNFLEVIEQPVLTIPSIQSLDLHSNRLRGKLPFFPRNAHYLDYSMNNLSSSIPPLIPSSYLYFLSLSNNHLNGSIPEWICNASIIIILDLYNNSLSGPVPQCISMLLGGLVVLNLGMNHLNGTISDALQPGCQLETLDMNGNCFSGKVPESLLNCKGLQVLSLGNNQINDTFPCYLKELSKLSVLVLKSNKFHGELGCLETNESWPMLQIMDLSSNSFSGKLLAARFFSWKAMMVVNEFKLISIQYSFMNYQDEVTLNLKGNEVKVEKILTILTSIDLSNNYFEGAIPQELGNLKALYCLNLSRNNFIGQIPPSLGSLKQLESLDLSKNKLSGSIPQQLADLNYLQVLNMSFNQLEGRIPRGGQFDNLCEDSFMGNNGLVGPQVKRKCNNDDGEIVASPATPLHDNNTRPKKSEVRWELIGAEVGFTVSLGILIGFLVFWKRWREWYFDQVERVLLKILSYHNQSRPNQLRRKGGN